MPRVLITGAAGFIGMHTCTRFLKEGWDVDGLDNLNSYYSVKLKKQRIKEIEVVNDRFKDVKFRFFHNDLNSNIWEKLSLTKYDSVIHLAAQAGVRYSIENPRAYLEANVIGFQRVIEFVIEQNIRRFIYASSSSVYGKNSTVPFHENNPCESPESYYAATKKFNELMAYSYSKTHGLNSIGLRFFTVYGPWGRPDMAPYLFTKAALEGQAIKVFNHGNQKRDFTYIDDIVEGIYGVNEAFDKRKGSHVLNIGRGEPVSLMEFIETIELITNYKIEKIFTGAQPGDVTSTHASIEEIQTFTGFRPRTKLTEGLERFIHWLKNYKE